MMDPYLLDGHKLLWHLDRVDQWETGARIAPLHIDLGITTGCNMRCLYCYGRLQGQTDVARRFDMPKRPLLDLLQSAQDIGVRSVAIMGEGENTLNDALYDALLHAHKIGLPVGLATNGLRLRRHELVLECLSWLRFNLSAADELAFNAVHGLPGRTLDAVLRNITSCVEIKRRRGLPVIIGLQMILLPQFTHQIVPMAKLGKEVGVDYLEIKPCSDTPSGRLGGPYIYNGIEQALREAETFSTKSYSVAVNWRKLKGHKTYGACYGTAFIIAISGDGRVFPCRHFFVFRCHEFFMGNILEASLKEVVESDRYWEVQGKVQHLHPSEDCEINCRQHYINEFLWAIQNPPPQVEFI
ncbi:MAG: radical SAM/SPASM domain-containing protein [Patescibacteria group bacterium]